MRVSKKPFAFIGQYDLFGIAAFSIPFFYTLSQMDYALNLGNYESKSIVIFKILTAVCSLFFAFISFAALYVLIDRLIISRLVRTVVYSSILSFLFINVLHVRYFDMPIRMGSLYSIGNLPFVGGYFFSLSQPADMIYPLSLATLICLMVVVPGKREAIDRNAILLLAAFFILTSFLRTGVFIASLSVKHSSLKRAVEDTLFNKTDHSIVASRYGFIPLFINDFTTLFRFDKPKDFIDGRERFNSLFEPAANENLPNIIMVQIESLDYEVLSRKVNGIEITPFLNSLADRSSFFTSFYAQHTGGGGTSDADFSSLTSFYPLANKPSLYSEGLTRIASLPFVLRKNGYTTAAFHANKAGFWGRSVAYERLGFDSFYSLKDYNDLQKKGIYVPDGPFFTRTLDYIGELKQPFFAFLITMSSHGDYQRLKYVKEKDLKSVIVVPEEKEVENYFRAINYVDSSLGEFVSSVEKQYKNNIIIIYGDHSSNIKTDSYRSREGHFERIPLFIVSSKGGSYRKIDFPGSHFDIPSTLLSLLGIQMPLEWQGINLLEDERRQLYLKDIPVVINAEGRISTVEAVDEERNRILFKIDNYIH